jgi:low affinity Fe/Cu permease
MNAHRFGFQQFATLIAHAVGSAPAFVAACTLIAVWGISGPMFQYSDTWQLWFNTATTIVTFMMVFLIQYTQNRDATALHLKIDELLRAVRGARVEMADLHELSDDELKNLERAFSRLAHSAAQHRTAKVDKSSKR